MKKILFKLPLFVMVALITFSCSRNPVTGKRQVLFMSEKKEIALGKSADPQIIGSMGLYEDEKLQKFINEKGKQMAAISHRPNLPYEFKIVDSPVVNAFAVPGGFVYFTRGIMAHFNNEAEFAGVLGHEIGHVTAKHGARQQTSQILSQVGFMAGVVLSPEFRSMAEQASQGMQLLMLKNSRSHESESDKLGVEYSSKIGYDATKMAAFFGTLKSLSAKSGQSIPTFMSTHPDPGQREQKVGLMARAHQQKNPGKYKVNRDSYLALIDGIVYGEDPKGGFVENWTFYHPVLKFKFPVPQGWQYQNSPTQFQMAPKDGKSMMMLTLAQGTNLREAANNTAQQLNLTVIENKQTRINGMPALEMISQVKQQQQQGQQQQGAAAQQVKVASTFIQYNNMIYVLHGMAYAADFNNQLRTFDRTMGGFDKLTDPDKLNRQPDRVRIRTSNKTQTLQQALQAEGASSKDLQDLSILNGMKLSDRLTTGMKYKVIRNGNMR